ncbi:MAG: type III-B CRISPR module-associated protein Cmr3 [Candidatus Lokiarchaeota archaeon]|nr:type III-B CRISPR module-associated protein Cmr3 [Candidatus Lokiarchaeota archaeon]
MSTQKSMVLKISNIDSLFFRDGRSFSMSQESWAKGMFPPFPTTIHGALRTEYFSNNIVNFQKRETPEDPTKDFMIKGIYLCHENGSVYAPLPRDIVIDKSVDDDLLCKLDLEPITKNILSSCKHDFIPKAKTNVEGISDGWIESKALIQYLKGDNIDSNWTLEPESPEEASDTTINKPFTILRLSNHMNKAAKIGIRINAESGASEEHYLYSLNRVRLEDLSLVVCCQNMDLPEKGVLKLGGRNGKAKFSQLNKNTSIFKNVEELSNFNENNLKEVLEKHDIVKIYLESPTIFRDFHDPAPLKNFISNLKANVISCAISQPLYIGGFDLKKGAPKSMYKAIAPGSLYYLKKNDSANLDSQNTILNNVSEIWTDKGLGIPFVGGVIYNHET